jgi:hypothetical protein
MLRQLTSVGDDVRGRWRSAHQSRDRQDRSHVPHCCRWRWANEPESRTKTRFCSCRESCANPALFHAVLGELDVSFGLVAGQTGYEDTDPQVNRTVTRRGWPCGCVQHADAADGSHRDLERHVCRDSDDGDRRRGKLRHRRWRERRVQLRRRRACVLRRFLRPRLAVVCARQRVHHGELEVRPAGLSRAFFISP